MAVVGWNHTLVGELVRRRGRWYAKVEGFGYAMYYPTRNGNPHGIPEGSTVDVLGWCGDVPCAFREPLR